MAPTFVSAAAVLITTFLAKRGTVLDVNHVTDALTTDITLIGSAVILVRQWWTGRSTWYGSRPK